MPAHETYAVTDIIRALYRTILVDKYMGKMTSNQMVDEPIGGWKTVADIESEAFLVPRLLRLSSIPFVGEETVKVKPETPAGVMGTKYWMIDSLDGTKNWVEAAKQYKHDRKNFELTYDTSFGIIVGQAEKGALNRGWSLEATYKDGK